MSLDLKNTRTFRALLLFIGFFFYLIGLGWWCFSWLYCYRVYKCAL